jgi:hypothetical protein
MSWLPSFFVEEGRFGPGPAAVTTAGIVALDAVGNAIGGWLPRFVARSASTRIRPQLPQCTMERAVVAICSIGRRRRDASLA